ncbi:hypothetical protein SCP_0600610 [Sparassis crispa]|uniref:Uncharacterized protein n=1 Tax=Sparassis crispa TaxID=139825 RepID=A0A401GPD6_9APHY|nr:hypothetical protein SCP_0600610 [Sparassis crispa]GBE84083.1 hypothetical protein SCP_0600610 [Sparassis crispa]
MIKCDCEDFKNEWNHHPISGPGTKNQSPLDLRLLGQTTNGVYADDPLDKIHPDVLSQYYGVSGRVQNRRRGQTGAGHPEDDSDSDDSDLELGENENENEDRMIEMLENRIANDQERNIRHKPIKVATHRNPFPDPQSLALFWQLLDAVRAQDIIPDGYGVTPTEWQDGVYPEEEVIRMGRKKKGLVIALPSVVWLPRAVLWAQAVEIMTRLTEQE